MAICVFFYSLYTYQEKLVCAKVMWLCCRYKIICLLCSFQQDYSSTAGVEVFSPVSHTLFNPADIIQKVCG